MKIGIPRSLLYYNYYPLWKTFYEELGYEIVLSPETNKSILNVGTKKCVDEACLPIKIYHGHVESIKENVDYLFIPRITSMHHREYNCPKICGLPEMVIHSIKHLPTMIKPNFNLHSKKTNIKKLISEMIGPLDVNFFEAQNAYYKGIEKLEIFNKNIKNGFLPEEAMTLDMETKPNNPHEHQKGKILVLSHSYNIYDSFSNMNLLKKIKDKGYLAITTSNMNEEKINHYASQLEKKMFWTFGRELMGAGLYAMEENLNIDGVIFVSSFACGLDSIIADYIERKMKRQASLPFIQFVIDEHTGEAGVDTRLEAFIEMIERRKIHDSNLSSYGEYLYRG